MIEQLKKDLVNDEKLVRHAYSDSLGFLTIGIGRLIDRRKGGGLSEDECFYLLHNDIRRVQNELFNRAPWAKDLDDNRKRALLNMCFQLGVSGVLNFKKMCAALQNEDWWEVHKQALDSLWAKQTPQRAKRIAKLLRDG